MVNNVQLLASSTGASHKVCNKDLLTILLLEKSIYFCTMNLVLFAMKLTGSL